MLAAPSGAYQQQQRCVQKERRAIHLPKEGLFPSQIDKALQQKLGLNFLADPCTAPL